MRSHSTEPLTAQTVGRQIGQQACGFVAHYGVALAAQLFELGPVDHGDVASAVLDHSQALQLAGGFGDALAAHAEHVGDQFLGHDQLVAGQAVEGQEQPAAQLLVDGVVAVADGGLGHLGDQRLGVAQHQQEHFAVAVELVLEPLPGQAKGVSRALHNGPTRGAFAAHEQ